MEQDNINQPLILGSEGNQPPPIVTNEELLNSANKEKNRDITKKDQKELDILKEEFKKDKEIFANDESSRDELTSKVVLAGERMFKDDSFRQELASIITDANTIGHDPVSKFSKYANNFNDIINGNLSITYDNNMPGYELADGWKSQQEVLDMIKANNVDQKSKEGFKILLDNQSSLASQANETEGAKFNYQKEYNNVMQKMVESGDIRSLANDKIFGERVFKDDLMESIQLGTYGDLGLSEEQVAKMGPTPSTPITAEDASYITSTIIKDEDMLKPYLAEYYTNALEQNYINNLNDDVRSAMEVEGKKNEPIKEEKGIKLKGGTVINGVYVPNKA